MYKKPANNKYHINIFSIIETLEKFLQNINNVNIDIGNAGIDREIILTIIKNGKGEKS